MTVSQDSFGLSEQTVDRIRSVLEKCTGIEKAILFGSRAKGNFKPHSDIDLTLVGPALGTGDLLKIAGKLDDLLLPYKIDLSLIHEISDADVLDHIRRVGVCFFSRES